MEQEMAREMKNRPSYAVSSVDHPLHIAAMLQLEGRLTVSEAAERLGIARSTAHRLLTTLVYRDFAVQDESRVYHAGPVLELAAHSPSEASRLRAIALPHLRNVVDILNESANLIARTGDTARFIASVECEQSLRVGNREGMVFPAHNITGGLVLLAELSDEQLEALFAEQRYTDRPGERPNLNALRKDLAHIRRQGFAVNEGRSERGVVAVGCPVRRADGTAAAGISISMPSVRYDPHRLRSYVATLGLAAGAIEVELHKTI
jgi:DNA-binding IclR family transcriptional regulator